MKKYKCNVVSLIVLFLICSISVGYSAFTSEMSIGNVVVYSGDVKLKLSNYSYINNTLTINNVSDDILIKN